jgi:Spore coat assembly protein
MYFYIDVDAFVDWYLVNEITKNNDAVFYSSVYLYFDPVKEKFCMGPIWDYDISLGNCNLDTGASSPRGFYINKYSWPNRIFKDPYFVEKVKARWNEKKNSIDALLPYIDERARAMDDAQKRNFERWDILGQQIWPNVVVTRSYQSEVAYMKSFLQQRIEWLDAAINNL